MARRDVTTIDGQVISVVYMTALPTFTGVIGGYTTSDDDDLLPASTVQSSVSTASTTATRRILSHSSSSSTSKDPFSYDLSTLLAAASSSSVAAAAAAAAAATSTASLATSDAYSFINSAVAPTSYIYNSNMQATASSTGATSAQSASSNTSLDSSNPGLSTAGKAGLAVGVILAIGAVLALILFLLGKKKKQVKAEQARQDSEKNAAIAAAANAPPADAPRLSLRPASSFLPEFMGGARPKSRLSQANMLGGPASDASPAKEKYLATPTPQSIPMTEKSAPAENPFKDPENPFADPIVPISHAPAPEPLRMSEPPPKSAPLQMPVPVRPSTFAPSDMVDSVDHSSDKIAISAASAGAAAAARAGMRHDEISVFPETVRPEPVEMPSAPIAMPTPITPHKQASVTTASAQAGPPDGQVYRILLDFTPSMEDELELKSGQVVRMLHEYDDGWCLCTRLDRSQQGVVPRTCLAAKPSKPRPGPGPNSRQMSPPTGPPQSRPMSPAMHNGPPRAMSPSQSRSMSPGPQGRPQMGDRSRSMSPAPMGSHNGVRSMSPGAYNQPPRPLSPGPRSSQQTRRAQSPGPYGTAGGPKPMAPTSRRRSRSSSAAAREVRDRRASPPGPSPLGGSPPGLAI